MKILYLGAGGGTSRLRRTALDRLGHEVEAIDPYSFLPASRLVKSYVFRTGALGFAGLIEHAIWNQVAHRRYDLVFVDNGELISQHLASKLKTISPILLNFNLDNPFTSRDGGRWRLLLGALPEYDFFITPRKSSVAAAHSAGAKAVLRFPQTADEIIHAPTPPSAADRSRFASDVSFVGTWFPERGPFLSQIAERNVPLRIFGPRWNKASEYQSMRSLIEVSNLTPRDFSAAIQCSKISIALLSKGNADLHTTRSAEIPALGVVLCGERTEEHTELYSDGIEAVFWDTPAECADLCLELLSDPGRLASIAAAGRRRVIANGCFNEPTLSKILKAVTQ